MLSKNRLWLTIVASAVLAYSLPAQSPLSANPSSGDAIELDPFPVVGTRLPDASLSRSPAIVVMDSDFITRTGATDLSGLLSLLPQTYAGAGAGVATVPNGAPSYGNARALFNFTTGSAPPLKQTGVSSVGLRGLGAGGTLVLVDGRRLPLATQEDTANDTGAGFYDLSSIPLGMVERVEVLASGASAVHGSDAVGGVVNVVLKRNYTGGEFVAGFRATEQGGGLERHGTLSIGASRGDLDLFLSLTARSRQALRGDQRFYSADQDATDRGGRNNRLLIGSPGVITADFGNLTGVTAPDGSATRYAIIPSGTDGTGLAVADFAGASGFSASNHTYLNTAPYKDLIGELEQVGLRGSATYRIHETLTGFASLTWTDRTTDTRNEPPATVGGGWGGAATILTPDNPYNPFDQSVALSLAHVEAPPRTQTVDVENIRAVAGLRGSWGESWQWETALTYSREDLTSSTVELDTLAFVGALADGSFNPFVDPAAVGPTNAPLYDALMTPAVIAGESRITSFDLSARGPVFELPAGAAQLAVGTETLRAERERASTNPVFGQPLQIDSARTTTAAFAELWTPLVATDQAVPAISRLSLRTAARYERTDTFAETTPTASLHWEPVPAVSLFLDYAEGFRAPALSEIEDEQYLSDSDIEDPRNGGLVYNVDVLRGGNTDIEAETSRTYQAGLTVRPPFLEGLSLRALGSETYYENKLNTLPPQVIVHFEDRFPGRVTRDGTNRITAVDGRTINFGKIYISSVDVGLTYDRETDAWGRFTLNLDATRQLEFRTEDRPDRAADEVRDGADTVSPPKLSLFGSLAWNRGAWDAAVLVNYLSGYESNDSGSFLDATTAYPSHTTVDLRLGYTFREGIWRGRAQGARLQVGVGNIADRDPPFANTVYGYNQGLYSPLGRTYDVSLRLPF